MQAKTEAVNKAKAYSLLRYGLEILETAYLLTVLFLLLKSDLLTRVISFLSGIVTVSYLILPLYLFILFAGYFVIFFCFIFSRSYLLEHKFSLTNQRITGWLADQVKAGIISYVFSLIGLEVFYYLLKEYPHSWWLAVSVFWIVFSVLLARVFPVLIIPLFFKYRKLSDDNLTARIARLAEKMKVRIIGVFEIDFSKKTLKGNAAFVGMGKTRRVILADTLRDKYTADEIEVILAHEFSHYRLRHMFKIIAWGCLTTAAIFFLMFKTSGYFLNALGLYSLEDFASLPLVMMYMAVFGIFTQPLQNYISRRFERDADNLALKTTGMKEAFISAMEKLAAQNLADRSPSPLIKFFFFDHPPIDERIKSAKI